MSTLREKKREVFEKSMKGDHVLVHIDSTKDGVIVPAHLNGNSALTLKLSYYFQGSTHHDESGIIANLVFSGRFFECVIPWDAIWGMTNDKRESSLWVQDVRLDVPRELPSAHLGSVSDDTSNPSTEFATGEIVSSEFLTNSSPDTAAIETSDTALSSSASVNREAVRRAVLRRVK